MRASLLLTLVLFGCPTKDEDDTGRPEGDADTGTDAATDTETPPVDEDRDGYDSDVDCNDNNYQVHPDAAELCDGLDNDCDELTDENFDQDGDGYQTDDPDAGCANGNDCDDTDADSHPGGVEVANDGIDQDCDGEDDLDGDDDGYQGGLDCDDTNPDVHPGATDTPYDGIDQDCSGSDLLDADGDGHDSDAYGGDDCDDADGEIHPGAPDVAQDGLDADCDGEDGSVIDLADAPSILDGVAGMQDLAGYSLASCDLDADGFDDLVVSAPFAESYAGQVGVWYGGDSSTWTASLSMTDADALLTSNQMFLGMGVVCGDVDGDGNTDLLVSRGEIDYYNFYVAYFGVVIFYGDGGRLDASFDESDGVELTMRLGITPDIPTVYSQDVFLADIDGDGAEEIFVNNSFGDDLSEPDGDIHVIAGQRYSTTGDLDDTLVARITPDSTNAITGGMDMGDVDGDGGNDLIVAEGLYTSDSADTGGYDGRMVWVDQALFIGGDLDAMAAGWIDDDQGEYFGYEAAAGDFDGDGVVDLYATSFAGADTVEGGGQVWLVDGWAAALSPGAQLADVATGTVPGDYEDGILGYRLMAVEDVDGDGTMDLLASEPGGAASGVGMVYVFGSQYVTGTVRPTDAALLRFEGESATASTGGQLAAGDWDGDGVEDYAVSAYTYGDDIQTGRVYLLLSSGW